MAAVPHHSQTLGFLYYNPLTPSIPPKPTQLYRPRRVGPGRIRIEQVLAGEFDLAKKVLALPISCRPKRLLSVKLAATRDNAKRFLRSVIAHPSPAQSTEPTSGGRRPSSYGTTESRIGAKRTRLGDSEVAPASLPAAVTAGGEDANMRGVMRSSISGPASQQPQRPRLGSDAPSLHSGVNGISNDLQPRRGSNGVPLRRESAAVGDSGGVMPTLEMGDGKPIASGNGVSMSIHLAEPVLFLQGFDNSDSSSGNTAMLRGSLHLRVAKSAKIKAVTLKFKGKAVTKWPEGIPPRKVDFDETDTIMSHTWPFFNAQFESAEKGTNADHVQLFKGPEGASSTVTRIDALGRSSPNNSSPTLTAKEARKLSLQVNQSRSFGKGDPVPGNNSQGVAAKGYRTFLAGDYTYNFELPLDSRLPETIDVELGSVKYELEAEVTRSGAFRANLIGAKEVTLIRAPAEGSLEQVEPIAISRNWEDQLHYDIVISGKSFPLGSQVPIAFKLTPLAKVQCHRIKVLVTETIEYFCANKRVHRMEPTKKVQLFEKRADGPPVSAFPGSTMRVTAGGGVPYDQRMRAAGGEDVIPVGATNLLGDLEAGGENGVGPTEMEFNVQLPSCQAMRERSGAGRLCFDTTYQNIRVCHWIKIVMRLSKPDVVDPNKRRHFEISIDSPFHILSCRATQANISLPAYSSPDAPAASNQLYECGCPNAIRRRNSPSSFIPAHNNARTGSDSSDTTTAAGGRPRQASAADMLARPPQAHIHHTPSANPHNQHQQRPIHMLRAPSFNPPAFEDVEEPPPPMVTPPPLYGDIASPTSGLADYFSRLSDAYDSDEADGPPTPGRVNVPLTPGGRVNRSMDVGRSYMTVGR